MLISPPAASPALSSDVSFHSPSRSPMKNHVSSSVGACSPLRPAIDERSKTTVFASIINTKLQQIRSLLDSAPSPAYVAALLACRRDEETPFDPDLAEDAARLLGKASTVGMTPLQVALMSLDAEDPTPWIARGEGNLVETRREIIRTLIEATPICDLDNVTWGISNTVLHLASFLGEQDAVRRLLEKGAKSTARNALNFAPVDVSADEETRSIFLRYAEEEAKRKPRKFHRKPEREWKALHASKTLTDERRPSYSSPRSRVDVIAKENAAESEDETSLPTIRIVQDEQESLDFTMNRPVTPNFKVPLASSNRFVAPLRLRTQSANPTGIQAEDVLKSPPCRTSTVSSSGILSTTVRESTTTGNLNVLSRDDDKYAAKPPGTPTAEARGMLGSSALVSKNPFRESSSPNRNLAFEGTATEKAARGALEADSLVSKSPFRVRHESSNENPRNYHLSPSSGMSKSKSIAGGFSQGSPKATNNLPLDKSADGFEQEKMKVQENTTGTDHPVDTLTRPVAEPDTAKPKRWEVEESLPTVRDNPFFRRLNAPGAEVGLVPRPQSLIEQWGTAQKLKKEVRRREPAHLMAGGGVISEKEWKEKKMKGKLNAEQTLHADCGENGSRIAPTEVSVQDPIVEPKIESASHAIIEGQNGKPAQTLEEQQEAAEEQPSSTVEELAVKYADVDQMLNTLLEGNPEEIDESSSQEGGSVCIHSDDDADITQSEVDPSEDASSVATDDREADLSPGSDPVILDVKENSDNVTELKEQSVPDNTTKPDEPKVVVQKKFVFPKLVLCKGTTYETRTRVVSGRFCTSAPVPSVSPNAPFTKPIPRPLPMPPSTHGRRARIPQITASVPGQDKFMYTNEQEYACSSAFATGSEGMENGRLYVRLHAMECLNLSKEVLRLAAIGGSATSGSNGGGSIPGDQSFVYCTLACNGNSVCTRPVTITGSKLIIDEEFELVAQPGSALTIKLAVIQPTQGTGGITSLNSSDDLSTKSKHDGLGKKLRMMFHSPSSQNLSGMTHGGTFSSRRGIPEQYGAPQSSLDGAPLASMQIQLNCDRLSEWSSPNAPGNGLNQEWEMITKAAAVVVPEEGSAGYGSRMGSRRAGKLSFRKGKKLWPNESKQNSIGPARNVTIGTVKASVVFWPFVDEKRPRNFDQCVKVLLEQQEGGASRWSPVQLKSHLSKPENLPPGIVHRILDVAFKSGCIKWSGTLSMRGADTKFWRRRYLVFYPPHLIALTTPGSLSDPKFSVALDLRQCRGLEAPFTQTQSGDELWQAATNGFRILFPGKSMSEVLNKTSDEGMGVSGEDYMVEFSADSMEEAKSLVSALRGAMISLGVSF